MATFENFEELQAWQRARALVGDINAISKHGYFSRDPSFRD